MIYVHIPFCHRKCTYCAFASTASARWRGEYVAAVEREIEQRRGEMTGVVRTVYFGGGTPTIMPIGELARLTEKMRQSFDLRQVEEATIECNPEDMSIEYMTQLRELRFFDRVSIGVQSFDDGILHTIGRRHSRDDVHRAVENAVATGFDNITIDLIYGLPGLDNEGWRAAIGEALSLPVQHLSAYALTVEEGTALAMQLAQGRIGIADEETVVEQYETLCQMAREAGLEHYEVSNFARPGYRSRHNSRYWNRTPYLGLGAAAHSFDGKRRRWNTTDIEQYIHTLAYESETLTSDDEHNETVMTALRTSDGLACKAVGQEEMRPYVERGWVRVIDNHYCPTDEGMLHADGMAAALFR